MLESVLVAVDLSPHCDRVWARVARLPLAPGARVTLIHVVPTELAGSARLRALDDANDALEAITTRGPANLLGRIALRREVRVGNAAKEISARATANGAELVLLGRGPGRAVKDFTLGSTAERVLRTGRLPVLLVRRAVRAPYEMPIAALDVDAAAAETVRFAKRLFDPVPTLDVVHATSAPFNGMVYPHVGREWVRDYEMKHQRERLAELKRLIKRGRTGVPVKLHGRNGLARVVIPEAVSWFGADLLMLGTRGGSAVGNAVLGTVAGDLLREVSCDVVVVPTR